MEHQGHSGPLPLETLGRALNKAFLICKHQKSPLTNLIIRDEFMRRIRQDPGRIWHFSSKRSGNFFLDATFTMNQLQRLLLSVCYSFKFPRERIWLPPPARPQRRSIRAQSVRCLYPMQSAMTCFQRRVIFEPGNQKAHMPVISGTSNPSSD